MHTLCPLGTGVRDDRCSLDAVYNCCKHTRRHELYGAGERDREWVLIAQEMERGVDVDFALHQEQ